jgi:cysteine desulfuration protein SufE
MPLPARLQAQLDDLAFFTDRSERIQALIELAEEFRNPGPDEVPRTEATRVPGCESEVFVGSRPGTTGRTFRFAVDNPQGVSAMALARILEEGLSDAPTEEVAQVPEEIVYTIFGRELSMGKSMGLTGMVRMVKNQAAKRP